MATKTVMLIQLIVFHVKYTLIKLKGLNTPTNSYALFILL